MLYIVALSLVFSLLLHRLLASMHRRPHHIAHMHTGMVLFLEEDHYVAEDFLHMLKLMETKSHEMCAKCNVLSLGTYLKTYNYFAFNNNNKVTR